LEEITFYHILAITSLVHVATYAWLGQIGHNRLC